MISRRVLPSHEQPWVAGRRRRKGLGAQDLPQRGGHGGDVHLAVRVRAQEDVARAGGSVLEVALCCPVVVMVGPPRGDVLADGTGPLGRSEP